MPKSAPPSDADHRAQLSRHVSDRRLINHVVNQVLFIDLGPSKGRGDRGITAPGKPYSPFDSP